MLKLKKALSGYVLVKAMALFMAMPAQAAAGDQETITLRVADTFPAGHVVAVEGIQFWMDRVEEETSGRVEFKYYPAGQLISSGELFSSVRGGTVDIAYVAPASFSSELPLSDVPSLPGFPQGSSAMVSKAYWDTIKNVLLEEEFLPRGLRPVIAFASGPYELMTTGDRITSPDSLNGAAMRTSGGTPDYTMDALGASVVGLPGAELYTALQRGTIDGAHFPIASMMAYDLPQVVSSVTTNAPVGSGASTYLINEQTWQELPDDIKAVMESATEAANVNLAEAYDAARVDVVEEVGGTVDFYELAPAVSEGWSTRFADVQTRWVKDREDRGLPAGDVLEYWSDALDAASE